MPSDDGYVGLLTFLSFGFSVIAAVLAIDLYALLRTGRSGSTWRVLIIASVMFALMHALRLAEMLNFGVFRLTHLSEIVELMFVMSLAYAFYLQRQTFRRGDHSAPPKAPRHHQLEPELKAEPEADLTDAEEAADEEEDAASEWARLNGQADEPTARAQRSSK